VFKQSQSRGQAARAATGTRRPVVLLGPLSDDPAESVSAVNGAFVRGLADRCEFVPLTANRTIGNTRQSRLNVANAAYFLRQWAQWTGCLARRRPSIAHSGSFLTFWNSLPAWRSRRARRELHKLDALILLSDAWREKIAAATGLPMEKLFVVNNPIDADFENEALAMPLERSGNIVFSLGAMGRPKGVMDILEAMTMMPRDPRYKIMLAGPEREPGILRDVRQFVAARSLSGFIELKSGVWGEEKARLYREASVFLLPSYYENFPLVVLEAAAAGLAIVTTPVGAIPEFFQDGVSALFVQPGNPAGIAGALQRLFEQPKDRFRLGAAARQVFCARLARSKIMDSLDSVYRQILDV